MVGKIGSRFWKPCQQKLINNLWITFCKKSLDKHLNLCYIIPMKLKLTRDEKEMIHLTALVVYAFTLIGVAIILLASLTL